MLQLSRFCVSINSSRVNLPKSHPIPFPIKGNNDKQMNIFPLKKAKEGGK